MEQFNLATFGRHDFLIRRLHSFLGLLPLSGYLVFHLFTNAAIIDGPRTYQHRSDQIHVLGPSTIVLLEWSLIFSPILFHGLIGLLLVTRGKRNVQYYPYLDNWRYTFQRLTGVIALVFVLWHVFELHGWFRWEWWLDTVVRPLGGAKFDPYAAPLSAAGAIQRSPWVIAAYAIGVTASVYHMANGLWTFGMSWGVWTSNAARRRMNLPIALIGVGLLIVGLGALYAMATVDLSAPALQPREPVRPPAVTERVFEQATVHNECKMQNAKWIMQNRLAPDRYCSCPFCILHSSFCILHLPSPDACSAIRAALKGGA